MLPLRFIFVLAHNNAASLLPGSPAANEKIRSNCQEFPPICVFNHRHRKAVHECPVDAREAAALKPVRSDALSIPVMSEAQNVVRASNAARATHEMGHYLPLVVRSVGLVPVVVRVNK